MSEPARDRWLSIGLSVLLHATVIGLLAYGWWHFSHPAPAPTLPIQATVVDARTLKGMGIATTPTPQPAKPAAKPQPPPQAPSPAPAPVVPQGPPQPSPQELAMRAQAAQEEAEHQAAAERELIARQQAKEKAEAEQRAAAKAAAVAQARKLAKAKKLAEAKEKRAEERKLAEQRKRALEQKLAAERAAAARAQRIAQLQRSLNEDARQAAASGELASWQAQITSRIQNAWIRPPTARHGLVCVLDVTQVQGGAVTGVTIGQCNGDEAVRESIEAAVYRASPLPPPPDPSLFQRELIITFKPTD
jgi:colicin import membrane protein